MPRKAKEKKEEVKKEKKRGRKAIKLEESSNDPIVIKVCMFKGIPPEMFINICQFLPPKDLLSLACVCKKFNNYLCDKDSITTQRIWKASREAFLPFLKMKPPNGMNEFGYVKLAVETGCQFCNKHKTRKVCWEFTVRACKDCINNRTVSLYYIRTNIIKHQQNVEDIVSGLPFIQVWFYRPWLPRGTRFVSLYWKDDVIRTHHEYLEMVKDQNQSKSEWFHKKKNEGKEKMLEVARRNSDYNTAFLDKQKENGILKQERSSKIREKITEFTKETDVNGNQIVDLKILQECPTYRSSLYSDKPQSPRPFTERAWKVMKNKLLKEYNELYNQKKQAKKSE